MTNTISWKISISLQLCYCLLYHTHPNMVTSLSKRAGAEPRGPSRGEAFSCHLDNKKQMSQLNRIASGSRGLTVLGLPRCLARPLFECDIYLRCTVRCPQNVPPQPILHHQQQQHSFLCVPSSSLSFFVCISPSISVPVPLLAVCRLTDGPLFAVLSYLSGGG